MRKICLRLSSLYMIIGCLCPRTITAAGLTPLAVTSPETPEKGPRTDHDLVIPDLQTHHGDTSPSPCQKDHAAARLCLSCALLPEGLSLPVSRCCEEAAARKLCALCLQWPEACLQSLVTTGDDVMGGLEDTQEELSFRVDRYPDADDVEDNAMDWLPSSERYSVLLADRPPPRRPMFYAKDLMDTDVTKPSADEGFDDDSAFPGEGFDDIDGVDKGQGTSGTGPMAQYGHRGQRYAIRFSPANPQGRQGRLDKRWGTLWIGKAKNWGRSVRGDYGKKWDNVQMEKRYRWTERDEGRKTPNSEQSPGEFADVFGDGLAMDRGEEEEAGRWVDPGNGWGPPVGDGELTLWSPQKRWGSLGLGKWRTQWGQATRRQDRIKRRDRGSLRNEDAASSGENEYKSTATSRRKQKGSSMTRKVQTLPERGTENDHSRGTHDKRWGWLGVSSHRKGSGSRGTPRRVKRSNPSHLTSRPTPELARDEPSYVRDLSAGRKQKMSQDLRSQSPPWHRRGSKASPRGKLETAETSPPATSQNHAQLVQEGKNGQGWRKASDEAASQNHVHLVQEAKNGQGRHKASDEATAAGGNEEVDQELFSEKWAKLDVGHNSPENQHPYWRYKTGVRG